jgi:hypothetical protein
VNLPWFGGCDNWVALVLLLFRQVAVLDTYTMGMIFMGAAVRVTGRTMSLAVPDSGWIKRAAPFDGIRRGSCLKVLPRAMPHSAHAALTARLIDKRRKSHKAAPFCSCELCDNPVKCYKANQHR